MSDQSELANPVTAPDDRRLVAALCRGDEGAFAALLDQYHQTMLRVALLYVPNRACGIFGITEVSQRILLHRARAKVHQALERYLEA